MTDVVNDIKRALIRELEGFKREIALFPDAESVWKTVPGVTNSAGNLALHVAGNVQYYIGAVLGGTGYVRNRELEFGRRSGSREEVAAASDAAIAVLLNVMPRLTREQLDAEFPEKMMGLTLRTQALLIHLCAHAGFHLGQAGYVRRALTGDVRSSGPLPLGPLAEVTIQK